MHRTVRLIERFTKYWIVEEFFSHGLTRMKHGSEMDLEILREEALTRIAERTKTFIKVSHVPDF
jgi:hypothetical protein